MRYLSFLAVWLLSSLILGVVHGPAMGAFFGLAVAAGYLCAIGGPARWRLRLQRSREAGHNSPEPTTYNRNRHRPA
jgi:hypothetical protein